MRKTEILLYLTSTYCFLFPLQKIKNKEYIPTKFNGFQVYLERKTPSFGCDFGPIVQAAINRHKAATHRVSRCPNVCRIVSNVH